MGQTTQSGRNDRLGVLHHAVPLGWQIGLGLLGAAVAVLAVRLPAWPEAALWRLVPISLLAVAVSGAGAGIYAGLTTAALVLASYLQLFAGGAADLRDHDLAWLPLLAVVAVGIAVLTGWLREAVGVMERELSGAQAMLQGANRRLESALETERLRSYYDAVTDLPSRRMVIDRFSQVSAQARRGGGILALLLLDLNRFKEINDSVGHDAGDEVLRQTGQRLAGVMRREDTIGRLDSDSFVVLLTGIADPSGIAIAARKIAETLEAPFVVGSPPREVFVSARLGTAIFPHDGRDWEDLYHYAEESMRLASRPA